jgi:hypothetical protein
MTVTFDFAGRTPVVSGAAGYITGVVLPVDGGLAI